MSDDDQDKWLTDEAARDLFESFTGGEIEDVDNIRDAITELYGTNRRGGPDTAAAAAGMGVSQRTIQRWIKGEQAPSARNAPTVESAKQDATIQRLQDADYIEANTDPAIAQSIAANGLSMAIGSADVQISGDRRPGRSFGQFNVPPALATKIQDAYTRGDQAGLRSGVEQALRENHIYAPVTVHSLGSINLTPR